MLETNMETIISIWFVVSVIIEISSTLVLFHFLRKRGVKLSFILRGIPGYLEKAYSEWCKSQGKSSKKVINLRILSMINLIASVLAAFCFVW